MTNTLSNSQLILLVLISVVSWGYMIYSYRNRNRK